MSEKNKTKLFLSYGRRDAAELANRLRQDLENAGYTVWQDSQEIRSGREWEDQIVDGLRSTQVVIALLTPHAVRRATDPNNPDGADSVCLDELYFARRVLKKHVVPILGEPCIEIPFVVCALDYVEMLCWKDSEETYQHGLKRLLESIAARLNLAPNQESPPLNPSRWYHNLRVLDFATQLEDKRRDFVGRQWLFDEIDAWRASSTRERAMLIVGDPGIGKSAFVAQMIHRNPGGHVLAYHICRADDPETLRPSTFVMSLAGMIAGRLPAFADLLESPQFQELFDPKTVSGRPAHVFDQGLLAALHQLPAPPDGIRYLLIDALDEALTLGEGQLNVVTLLSPRLDQFPAWLRIVATTRREPDVLNRLSSLRAASIDAHRQDNLNDIDRFIEARLQTPNLAERLAASRVPLSTVQQNLRDKADGNFLYVSQALQDIERDNYSFSRLDEMPKGLNQWYEKWFERSFTSHLEYSRDIRPLLQIIVARLTPHLHLDTIVAAMRLHSYEITGRLKRIGSLLSFSQTPLGTKTIHKSLDDWLTNTPIFNGLICRHDFVVNVDQGRRDLSDAGLRCVKDCAALSKYFRLTLPEHLWQLRMWEELHFVVNHGHFIENVDLEDYNFWPIRVRLWASNLSNAIRTRFRSIHPEAYLPDRVTGRVGDWYYFVHCQSPPDIHCLRCGSWWDLRELSARQKETDQSSGGCPHCNYLGESEERVAYDLLSKSKPSSERNQTL